MKPEEIDRILAAQRSFFQSGATLPASFRIDMLKKLRRAIQSHEADISRALEQDLGKCAFESYMCEIGMVLSELSFLIRRTRSYVRKHRVRTPLAQFAAVSYTLASPYGNTLIMSPWNYPFLLTLGPLADAIAAGNTAIVKPSAYSLATSRLLCELIGECFPSEYVAVVTGGREENARLLDLKFDMIFFTGSQSVGKIVLRHAAEHLTPVVLELGGKSPCIVDDSAQISLAAKRIVFGKLINCGQTCVAPDYVLCDARIKGALVREICRQIRAQAGDAPLNDPTYGRIVNVKHYHRLMGLIDPDRCVLGGQGREETLQIEPTLLDGVSWDDPVMQEEIFGPILPILTYRSFDEVENFLKDRPKPLALYLFSENEAHIQRITQRCAFGGGCANDTIIHLATEHMGFGGVGESGMGAYHGKDGFDAFSHRKSIVQKRTWIDLPMRYRPYRAVHEKLIRFFLK